MITLTQLAERLGAPDTSTMRYDIRDGALKAQKLGKTWIVEDAEAERYEREVWPLHVKNRKKPLKKSTRMDNSAATSTETT